MVQQTPSSDLTPGSVGDLVPEWSEAFKVSLIDAPADKAQEAEVEEAHSDTVTNDGDVKADVASGNKKKRKKKKKGSDAGPEQDVDAGEDGAAAPEASAEVGDIAADVTDAACAAKSKRKRKKKGAAGQSEADAIADEGAGEAKDKGGDGEAEDGPPAEPKEGGASARGKLNIITVETMDYTFIENEGQCKVTVSLRNVAVVKQVLFIDNQRFAIVFTSNSHLFQKAHAKQGATRDTMYKWPVTTAGPYIPQRSDFATTNRELIIKLQKVIYMIHPYMSFPTINMWGRLEEGRERDRLPIRPATPGSEDGGGGRAASKPGKGKGKGKGKHGTGKGAQSEAAAQAADDATLQLAEEGGVAGEDDAEGAGESGAGGATPDAGSDGAAGAADVSPGTRRRIVAQAAEDRRRESQLRGVPHVIEAAGSKAGAGAAIKVPRGTTGLENLGNTCFMNAVIQSLAHAPEIYRYFAGDAYEADINPDNPLGMQGELARAFGALLKELWAGTSRVVAPAHFKQTIGRFAKQFVGRQQHDAQEFLGFLLDGLHEDLNKVTNKPYIEVRDARGRPDIDVSKEQWDNHKARNDSTIDDLFQGQYRSVVRCGECGEDSVTFDPFMYLSLPIPPGHRVIELTVVLRPPRRRKLCRVWVPDMGHITRLRAAVAQALGLEPEQLVLAEIWQHKVHRLLTDAERIESIRPGDAIYAYEIVAPAADDPAYIMPVVQRAIRAVPPTACFKCSDKLKPPAQPLHVAGRIGTQPCVRCFKAWYCSVGCREDDSFHSKTCQPAYENHIDDPFLISFRKSDVPEGGLTYGELGRVALDHVRAGFKKEVGPVSPGDVFAGIRLAADAHDSKAVAKHADDKVDVLRLDWEGIAAHTLAGQELYVDWIPTERDALVAAPAPGEVEVVTSPEAAEAMRENTGFEQPAQAADLHKCLQLYAEEETLDADDAWYCPKCRKHQIATKTLTLWRLPPLMVVHLKRFSYTRVHRHKIDVDVDYPLAGLDLAPYMQLSDAAHGHAGSYTYDLFAVVEHHGALGGGHYTAHALNDLPAPAPAHQAEADEGIGSDHDDEGQDAHDAREPAHKWYFYNDRSVTEARPADARNAAAYVLFYRRRPAAN